MDEARIPFDDGHKPGSTKVETTVVTYANKTTTKFVAVFDDVLPELWQKRIYDHGVQRGRPWGERDVLIAVYLALLIPVALLCTMDRRSVHHNADGGRHFY